MPFQAVGDPWLLAASCPFLLLPHVVSLWPCIAGVFPSYKGSGTKVLRGHSALARLHFHQAQGWWLHFHQRSRSGVSKQCEWEGAIRPIPHLLLLAISTSQYPSPTALFPGVQSPRESCAQGCTVPTCDLSYRGGCCSRVSEPGVPCCWCW